MKSTLTFVLRLEIDAPSMTDERALRDLVFEQMKIGLTEFGEELAVYGLSCQVEVSR